jgi:hypothetical protein
MFKFGFFFFFFVELELMTELDNLFKFYSFILFRMNSSLFTSYSINLVSLYIK